MRGLAALRTSVAPGGALAAPWVRNSLWNAARAVPSLDLRFSENKSLVDATTGANLVTFSRASGGTYVDSQGVIRKATTNLLLRSEEFDDASWALLLSASLNANQAAAPNGSLSADQLTISNSSAFSGIRQNYTFLPTTTYTFSVWVRAVSGTASFRLKVYDGTADTFTVNQSATETWQRYALTMTTAAGAGAGNIAIANIVSPLNQQSIYLWGAQLEQSSTVGEYIPTGATINSAPRFDHNPTTGESLGLLVEEQRTNLLLRSEEFDQSPWSYSTATISSNAIASPTGSTTADKLIVDSGQSSGYATQAAAVTAGTTYTFSVFAKAAELTELRIVLLATGFGTASTAQYDLSLGTVLSLSGAFSSASIQSLSNGWFRLVGTATATASASPGTRFQAVGTGDGTSGIYLWGAQLEQGAFPTSYIKTEAATATRSADVASISGSNFSSWYRQDEGTVFAETNVLATATGTNRIIQLSGATTADRHDLFFSGGTLTAFVNVGGVAQVNAVTSNSISANQNARSGYAYKQNDFSWMLNAGPVATDASGTLPAVDKAGIGVRLDAAGSLNGTIKRLAFWPQRLGNEVLQRITQ